MDLVVHIDARPSRLDHSRVFHTSSARPAAGDAALSPQGDVELMTRNRFSASSRRCDLKRRRDTFQASGRLQASNRMIS